MTPRKRKKREIRKNNNDNKINRKQKRVIYSGVKDGALNVTERLRASGGA